MPKRPSRAKRRKIEAISPQYLDELKLRDFLGQLTEDEIPIAKKHNVYRWDEYIKNRDGKRSATT